MDSFAGIIEGFLGEDSVVYVATSDESGLPHIAAARGPTLDQAGKVCFSSWFCNRTMQNLKHNPRISLALMDPVKGEGFQLIGRVERVEQAEVMDGYSPDKEEAWSCYPQTRYRLVVEVEQVLDLSTGPHSDRPIKESQW